VGTTSAARTETVTNSGAAGLTSSSVVLTGANAGDLALSDTGNAALSLARVTLAGANPGDFA